MNAEVLNARALTMRVGAVLAAFVLAFSLLVVAPPAHASTLSWSNTRFSGDEVIFNEVSPRTHDTGMVTLISQELSEFALHARAILGLPIPEITLISPSASKAIVVEGKSQNVQFGGIKKALAQPHTNIRLFGKGEVNGHRRLGVLLARDVSVEKALEKVKQAYEQLEISL